MKTKPTPIYSSAPAAEALKRAVWASETQALRLQQALEELTFELCRRLDRAENSRRLFNRKLERLLWIAGSLAVTSLVFQLAVLVKPKII